MAAASSPHELFRCVNERLVELGCTPTAPPSIETSPALICECANLECTERLPITLASFERFRSEPSTFVALPEHVPRPATRIGVVAQFGATAAVAFVAPPRAREDRPGSPEARPDRSAQTGSWGTAEVGVARSRR